MVEFLQDLIDRDPSQEFSQKDFKAGTSVLRTGDSVTDAWAKEIAEGKTPDFLSVFSAEDQERIQRLMKQQNTRPVTVPQVKPSKPPPQIERPPEMTLEVPLDLPLEGFHDEYGKEK